MKQTGGDKGVPLIAVRIGAVAPLLSHVSGVMLTWVTLFVNGRGRYQLYAGKNCKGIIRTFISLGKTLRDWRSQENTYLIT